MKSHAILLSLTSCLAAALVVNSVATATTLDLTFSYAGSLASDGITSIGFPLVDDPSSVSPGQYHQFSVYYQLFGAAANEDFGAMQFDVDLGPGFSPSDYNWVPIEPLFDPVGPPPPISIYSENRDAGADTDDLQRIVVIGRTEGMHSLQPGIGSPEHVGDFFVHWNGSYGSNGITGVGLAPNGLFPWGVYVGTTLEALPASSFIVGPDFLMRIPEPSTFALLGLAIFGSLAGGPAPSLMNRSNLDTL